MNTQIKFKLKLLSDYHISSGHGSAALDSSLQRDVDGVPLLRGSQLAGLLRDGLRMLHRTGLLPQGAAKCLASASTASEAPAYCPEIEGAEPCLVCRLFGSPARPRRWLVSGGRPLEMPARLKNPLVGGGGGDAARVKLSPRVGGVQPGALFGQEHGDQRLVFGFELTCREGMAADSEIALLVAAARMVRFLGGSRRRGLGECLIEPLENWPAVFEQNWLDKVEAIGGDVPPFPDEPPDIGASGMEEKSSKQEPTSGPYRLILIVYAREALLASRRAENGGQYESQDYIPAAALRGALAGRAFQAHPGKEHEKSLFELFFGTRVRLPMLYQAEYSYDYHNIYPSLPVPRDWQYCKIHGGFVGGDSALWNLMKEPPQNAITCEKCWTLDKTTEISAASGGYLKLGNESDNRNTRIPFLPNIALEMHHQVDALTGRVVENRLYSYSALQSGECFCGEVLFSNQADWRDLQEMAHLPELGQAFELFLGKANGRGYGHVDAVLVAPKPVQAEEEMPPLEERVDPHAELVITLLSDTILVDEWGRSATGFECGWLAKALGKLELAIEVPDQYCATRVVDGFNAYHGLPRWRTVALAAGSSAKVNCNLGVWDLAVLKKLEEDGLGERRGEGFGRLAINHPINDLKQVIRSGGVPLPESIQRHEKLPSASWLSQEPHFENKWRKELATLDGTCWQKEEFVALARLLDASKSQTLSDIRAFLGRTGRREQFGYSVKENAWPVDPQKGQPGIEKICKALQKLEETLDKSLDPSKSEKLMQRGIALLAEVVAENGRMARKGTQG